MSTNIGGPHPRPKPTGKRVERRTLGGLEGRISMSQDFDDPDEELLKLIENSKVFPDDSTASKQ